MKKEIAKVNKIPPAVAAEYYVGLWLANDAVLLRNELQAGFAVVSELLARDLQDAAPVDKADMPAKTILVTGDKRVVSRMNLIPFKGSLVSEPVDYVRPGSTGMLVLAGRRRRLLLPPGSKGTGLPGSSSGQRE